MKHFILVISLLVLQACSVGMAMSGKESPDLGALGLQKSRGEIELHLGSPIKTSYPKKGIRVDTYEYEIGNEPSAGRAIGHGVMDVLTLGAWEIIGTPIEGITGDKYHAIVTYNSKDLATDIKTKKITSGM